MMEKYNDIKAFLFLLVLLGFIVGGYILMKNSTQYLKPESPENNEEVEKHDIRLDVTKDYIYFSDREEIAHELDIVYQNINLNFNDPNKIAEKLNTDNAEFKQSLIYDETLVDAPHNNLVGAKYMIYNTYTYDKYLSLIVDYYNYDSEELISYLSSKVYVFDKTNGDVITEEELLSKFGLTKESVLEKIKYHIDGENIAKENEELDAQATVDGISNLNLYVDKIGRLSISVLVKSDQKDYNEIIVLS